MPTIALFELNDVDLSCLQKSKIIIHSDKKILIQNIKTVSSDTNAQPVLLAVYKYSDWEKKTFSANDFLSGTIYTF